MLLTIDIGNSNIVFGIFDGTTLKESWRIKTEKDKDAIFYRENLSKKHGVIHQVIIGSVVPELDSTFAKLSEELCHTKPLFASTELTTGIKNLTNLKSDLGADLLSDIVATIHLYPGNSIVIDLGTASKFLAVTKDGAYKGGAIAPGIGSSFQSLLSHASKLGAIELGQPKKVVGSLTTAEHLNSGFVYGFASMIDGMIERIKQELDWDNPTIIITGGFTDLATPHLHTKVIVNKDLTLEGLQILFSTNS